MRMLITALAASALLAAAAVTGVGGSEHAAAAPHVAALAQPGSGCPSCWHI
jgi:hypothetical protein